MTGSAAATSTSAAAAAPTATGTATRATRLLGAVTIVGIAWLALIVAEQVNAQAGIGFMINNARDFLQTDIIVVGLLTYAVLGLLTDSLVRLLERRALRWRDEGVTA